MKDSGRKGQRTDRMRETMCCIMDKRREERGKRRHKRRRTFHCRIVTGARVKEKWNKMKGLTETLRRKGQYNTWWQCDGKLEEVSVSEGCYQTECVTL